MSVSLARVYGLMIWTTASLFLSGSFVLMFVPPSYSEVVLPFPPHELERPLATAVVALGTVIAYVLLAYPSLVLLKTPGLGDVRLAPIEESKGDALSERKEEEEDETCEDLRATSWSKPRISRRYVANLIPQATT